MVIAQGRTGLVSATACLAVLLLAGCAQNGAMQHSPAPEAAAVAATDPVVAFVSTASPGAEDSVVLSSTGQTASVRLVRAYAAASGRECREVLVRTGGSAETRLLCRTGTGWREARPLIRDASARQ